ncbi:MAG: 3-deoxy-7-phosphoheptulonate synthase [Deltaproteobacteria bacterium]|nr:3-deoxy-7-phosphoheptulonate synthase [Deltaproteobacteria bacterium]
MIVVMKIGASKEAVLHVEKKVREMGFKPHPIYGTERTVVAAVGPGKKADLEALATLDGVEGVVPISKPYKLASREVKKETSVIDVREGAVKIGGKKIVVMAGPCSVEGKEQLVSTAKAVKKAGARMLRGGAWKPRTSPYDFQGMEAEGLELLAIAREETGLPVITEVMNACDIELIDRHADVFQVGARNVQNFGLLKELGQIKKPVFLKRGMATTIKEWLMSAEYVIAHGNPNVILCERGIRTFETSTRNTLDLNAVPVVREQTHLPIVVDPSHGTGHWQYVTPMALAAIAAGADGLMIEVHPDPERALSDGGQSLKFKRFEELMKQAAAVAKAVGREI